MRIAYLALALFGCHRSADKPTPDAGPAAPNKLEPARRIPPPPAPPPTPAPANAKMPAIAGVDPVEGDYAIKDFVLSTNEHLPELRIHYTTYGTLTRDAAGHASNAVLIMHGTTGSGAQFTRKQFADELFQPGQPLDLKKFYVILPDDIGHGKSSKPSDGLRAKFPHYGYTDMVIAEHLLVTDHLKVDHLRLVMGTSMGCMHSWMWIEKWPAAMDAAMPLACLPVAIAGRNRQWRKMAIDAIQHDPAYQGGDYKDEPRAALEAVSDLMAIAGSAPIADQNRLPTRAAADKEVEDSTAKFIASHDANDLLYAIASSSDYDPSKELEAITTRVAFVNSGDDFINPPELAIAEREIKRVKNGHFVLIPASDRTHGHGTHTWAALWKSELVRLLQR